MGDFAGRTIIGTFLAMELVLAGIVVWDHQSAIQTVATAIGHDTVVFGELTRLAAVCLIAAGQFVFLCAVADRLCPSVRPEVRWFAKTLVAAVGCVAMIGVGYEYWRLI